MKILNVKRFVKAILFSFTFMFFGAFTAFAQVPVPNEPGLGVQEGEARNFSDEELEQFVTVYQKASEIQQKNEAEMIQAIEDENLEMERFNEILMSRQNQQAPEEINATAEELNSFNKAAEKIMQVQQEAQTEITQLIEEELGAQTYQEIVSAYQQDPEVQEKVNQMLQEEGAE